MPDAMIEITDLTRHYGPLLALDHISLSVPHGQVMGFLGPNGAGKTTAMRILAGLLAPSEGSVRIAGIDILEEPEAARANIGFLPETPPIYEDMVVREYLAYLAALRRVPRERLGQAVERAIERCGLGDVANRLLRNLSKGFRQRAGIAQAIVHSPSVVILDEPTVGLDPIQIREIRTLIRDLAGEHSVLLSTHILPEVQMTCDRVAVINRGRIVAEDTLSGLEQRTRGREILRVRWAAEAHPTLEQVRALPGVAEASQEGATWHLTARSGADPVPELVRRGVAEGWELRELSQVSQNLEEIFVQLTTHEADHPAQEAA